VQRRGSRRTAERLTNKKPRLSGRGKPQGTTPESGVVVHGGRHPIHFNASNPLQQLDDGNSARSDLGDNLGDSSWSADGLLLVSGATARVCMAGMPEHRDLDFSPAVLGFQGKEGFRWEESGGGAGGAHLPSGVQGFGYGRGHLQLIQWPAIRKRGSEHADDKAQSMLNSSIIDASKHCVYSKHTF